MMLLCTLQACTSFEASPDMSPLERGLAQSGENRPHLEAAVATMSGEQRADLVWLIEHMPESDLTTMTSDRLVENVSLARAAFDESPWRDEVPLHIYRDAVLPYACINETRDDWRADFRRRFSPLVAEAVTTSQAAAILNNTIFKTLDVIYSTKRPRADQSPLESIEAGMASCTGLSILLVDACRSVGIPARLVGTPLWTDGSGNHSWVEIYDSGRWHFTGAAEPTGPDLDKAWFSARASVAIEGHPEHAILAVTWRRVPLSFPLPWAPGNRSVRAVDVTSRYASIVDEVPEGMMRVRFVAVDHDGTRQSVPLRVAVQPGGDRFDGTTRDERFDTNDHLEMILPVDSIIEVEAAWPSGRRTEIRQLDGDQPLVTLRPTPTGIKPSDPG